jgi:solute carrier family 13 (sodium-dependent dicarboxylate transporter), member 2/3/5
MVLPKDRRFCLKLSLTRWIVILLGPLIAAVFFLFIEIDPAKPLASYMAGIAVWMAWWWLTESVPHYITSLIPILFIPLMGIAGLSDTALEYVDRIILLFLGGFVIAIAIEKWDLHKRIAYRILMAVGSKPSRVLFGIMLCTFLFSMWISNTATVMMLLPAVLAVINRVSEHIADESQKKNFAAANLLGLAYAASIGGMATLVGTPTNMIFFAKYVEKFPLANDMNFPVWFLAAFPVSALLALLAFFVLKLFFLRKVNAIHLSKDFFRERYRSLGKMTREEKLVAGFFCFTALMWFTRSDIDFGAFVYHGWGGYMKDFLSGVLDLKLVKKLDHDFLVAVLAAIILFFVPAKQRENGKRLIEIKDMRNFPVSVLILFGGGFAMAYGIEASGLSSWFAIQLQEVSQWNLIAFTAGMCVLICIISEFSSNVACIQLMLPILLSLYPQMGIHPLLLLVPATLASSLGFMLPVATAPNTIVFGTKRIRAGAMMSAGIVIDLLGILLIVAGAWLLGYFY